MRHSWRLGAPLQIGDVLIPSDHLVAINLVLDKVSEGVAVSGKVAVNWIADCARCLRQIDGQAAAEIEELFEQIREKVSRICWVTSSLI